MQPSSIPETLCVCCGRNFIHMTLVCFDDDSERMMCLGCIAEQVETGQLCNVESFEIKRLANYGTHTQYSLYRDRLAGIRKKYMDKVAQSVTTAND